MFLAAFIRYTFVEFYFSNCYCRRQLLLATETGCPIAHATDRVITETLRTGIFPAHYATCLKFGTGYEFPARKRMREIALIQAFDYATPVQNHLQLLPFGVANNTLIFIIIVVIVDDLPMVAFRRADVCGWPYRCRLIAI